MKLIHASADTDGSETVGQLPSELVALKERILDQPPAVREELEPLIDEVMEHAVFRSRVMLIARDALQRFRVDLAAMQFDLEATRRERNRALALNRPCRTSRHRVAGWPRMIPGARNTPAESALAPLCSARVSRPRRSARPEVSSAPVGCGLAANSLFQSTLGGKEIFGQALGRGQETRAQQTNARIIVDCAGGVAA